MEAHISGLTESIGELDHELDLSALSNSALSANSAQALTWPIEAASPNSQSDFAHLMYDTSCFDQSLGLGLGCFDQSAQATSPAPAASSGSPSSYQRLLPPQVEK